NPESHSHNPEAKPSTNFDDRFKDRRVQQAQEIIAIPDLHETIKDKVTTDIYPQRGRIVAMRGEDAVTFISRMVAAHQKKGYLVDEYGQRSFISKGEN